MTAFVILCTGILSMVFAAGPLLADGDDIGQVLYDEECTMCHTNSIFTRADRKVQSLEQLQHQVNRCKDDVGAEWTETQTGLVVKFLNSSYYKFE